LPLAPADYCTAGAGSGLVSIAQPASGSTVQGIVQVVGTVQLPDLDRYEAQYGIGGNPQGWGWISGPHLAQVRDGLLTEWDTSHLAPGPYTLRITAFDRQQHRVEARVQVLVAGPVEAPTVTPLSVPTDTPVPSATPSPTETPAPTETPMATPLPTETPTGTPAPVLEPTFTPTLEPPAPVPTDTPEVSPTP
jgi:hypothetical protein